jgi:methylated-DNA-[protein]-cysteine S-methyltransferase
MTLTAVPDRKPAATRAVDSPVGPIMLAATAAGLTHVQFASSTRMPCVGSEMDASARRHLDATERALKEYFAGQRTSFDDLMLAPAGTPFQMRVWKALRSIPFGRTATYGEIASKIRRPGSARAVGFANHRNPIAIIVPCHRVVGADGSLTGYASGLDIKAWLLRHEGVQGCALR